MVNNMNIDFTKIDNVQVGGIQGWDAPDFCDAYIESCDIEGVPATDEQLDFINSNSDFVHEKVMKFVY
jgi:hypothetical protein